MNIILFYPEEVEHPLSRQDVRARHILEVLRLSSGDSFDAGLINGPRGKGTLIEANRDSLVFSFAWAKPPPPLWPIHLLIGMPRPQTSRDILRDATTLGVASIHFVRTEKSETGYSNSTLWKSNEWKNCVINGAAQAFCTRLPEITHHQTLRDAIAGLSANTVRAALDNYEASISFSDFNPASAASVTLAIGSERGWSAGERTLLRDSDFVFAHLGERALRTETACIAALSLLRSKLGLF